MAMSNHEKDTPENASSLKNGSDDNVNQTTKSVAQMAAEISELRKIMEAAAKHFNIEVPIQSMDSPVDINLELLRPTASSYSEETTIKYLMRQLPSNATVESYLCSEDSSIQGPSHLPRPLTFIGSTDSPQAYRAIFEWLPPNTPISSQTKDAVLFRELSYDADGYICLMTPIAFIKSHRTILPQQADPHPYREHVLLGGKASNPEAKSSEERSLTLKPAHPGDYPWAGQRFGKDCFTLRYVRSPPSQNSIMTPQDSKELGLDFSQKMSLAGTTSKKSRFEVLDAAEILRMFTGWWPNHGIIKSADFGPDAQNPQDRLPGVLVHFEMRFLSIQPSKPEITAPTKMKRYTGSVRIPGRNIFLNVLEKRIAVALRTTCRLDLPVYSMVTVMDYLVSNIDEMFIEPPAAWAEYYGGAWGALENSKGWRAGGIQPSIRSTAFDSLAFRMMTICWIWRYEWLASLGAITKYIRADLSDILTHEGRNKILYDDKDLRLSEFYFFLQRILEFAEQWSGETTMKLETFASVIEQSCFDDRSETSPWSKADSQEAKEACRENFRRNWRMVLNRQEDFGKVELRERIRRLQERIKTLKDGVSTPSFFHAYIAHPKRQARETHNRTCQLFTATSVSETTKSKQLNHLILVFTIVTIFHLPLSFVTALYALGMFSWDDKSAQKKSFITTTLVVAGTTYLFAGSLSLVIRTPVLREAIMDPRKALYKLLERPEYKAESNGGKSSPSNGHSTASKTTSTNWEWARNLKQRATKKPKENAKGKEKAEGVAGDLFV
ncbi:hypothetical protein QBC35DRAFT_462045 [Podospora australis]|uniref:Uncharacterized protein n=1 Tax=Podospora australis TaxID=1536484 RepID=A0AAN6WX81_9PEZI|nr:hypothetical protein QBC35DRAFT_462045 [Podospora australis]